MTYQNKKWSHQHGYSSNLEKYRYCEMINYFNFLGNIIIPPNNTNLKLNFRFSQINFYFASQYEVPSDGRNSCIQILFECLEISIIIKLWCSILTEKHIIIMANQNFLLFSICEALMRLIFPLKWLHTYIPLLPDSQIEYLEAPTPYIMGILSSAMSFETLKENFPDHVICNVDTSEIHAENVVKLPQVEETKLRKKLQFVKNPEIFDIEEIITEPHNKIMIEDVMPDRSFSDNVQQIFFRIFKNALKGFKLKYMIDSVFYQEDFLNDLAIHSEEHRNFWDKIIKTFAFEYFILSNQYLEDSNTKIFKNITKRKEDKTVQDDIYCYNISITISDDNIENFFKEITSNSRENYDRDIQNYQKFVKDIKNPSNICTAKEVPEIGNQYYQKTEELEEATENQVNYRRKMTTTTPIKWNNQNLNTLFHNSLNSSPSLNEKSNRKNTVKFDPDIYLIQSKTNLLNCKFMDGSIKCQKESDEFSFYKSKVSKKSGQGFLHYVKNIYVVIKDYSGTNNFFDLGMRSEFKKVLLEKLNKKPSISDNLAKIDESVDELDENEFNLELNSATSSTKEFNSLLSTAADKFNIKSSFNPHNSDNSGKNKWVDLSKVNKNEILELDPIDCNQNHLTFAFLLEEFVMEAGDKENYHNLILCHYEEAYKLIKKEFPSVRFYQFIDKLDSDILCNLRASLYKKYPDRKRKRIFSDSDCKESDSIRSSRNSRNSYIPVTTIKTHRLLRILNVKFEKIKRKHKKIQSMALDKIDVRNFDTKEIERGMERSNTQSTIDIKNINRIHNLAKDNANQLASENSETPINIHNSPNLKIENLNLNSISESRTNTIDSTRRGSAFTAVSLKIKDNILNSINHKYNRETNFPNTARKIENSSNPKSNQGKESFSNFLESMKSIVRDDIKKICVKNKKEFKNSKDIKEIKNSNDNDNQNIYRNCFFSNDLKIDQEKNIMQAENTKKINGEYSPKLYLNIKSSEGEHKKTKNSNIDYNNNLCSINNSIILNEGSNVKTNTNVNSNLHSSYNLNFIKNIKNYFFPHCDANRIIDNMKKCDTHIKTVVLNNNIKYSKSIKDPLVLIEEICRRIIYLFEDNSLNKFNSDVLNTKIIQKVITSDNFNFIKENVAELQKVNITKFSSRKEKICFWLNLFNFLTIFTILYNSEILSTQYEWIKFLKNSTFNVGGYDLSLYEILNCILLGDNFYGNADDFFKFNTNDVRKKLSIEEKSIFISFAVALPTK